MREFEPTAKPGLIQPGLACIRCGYGAVEWLHGGSWTMEGTPQPHYLCYNCASVFHLPRPKKPLRETVWKAA